MSNRREGLQIVGVRVGWYGLVRGRVVVVGGVPRYVLTLASALPYFWIRIAGGWCWLGLDFALMQGRVGA